MLGKFLNFKKQWEKYLKLKSEKIVEKIQKLKKSLKKRNQRKKFYLKKWEKF